MSVVKDKSRKQIQYRRIELLMPKHLTVALDNYRASKRPIPTEADAIRWLMTEGLISEGFEPQQETT
jgi:hypothetical protein